MEHRRRKILYEDFVFDPGQSYKESFIVTEAITADAHDPIFQEVRSLLVEQIRHMIPKKYRCNIIITTSRKPLGCTKVEWEYIPMRDVE